MNKPIAYVDMDEVLCKFKEASKRDLLENPGQPYPQSRWGFFLNLDEIEDAIKSVHLLSQKYDVWILSRPSFRNVNSFTEKAQWIWNHLGYEYVEKLILCGDKSLLKGQFLIDDSDTAGQPNFEGEWIQFGQKPYSNWSSVTNYLMNL